MTIMTGMIETEGLIKTDPTPAPPAPMRNFVELSLASLRSSAGPAHAPWAAELRSEERGLCLIQLLLACANSVSSGNVEQTNAYLENIATLASLTGDPMQRLATYFMEALAARLTRAAWPGLHRALNSTRLPSPGDASVAQQVFYTHFPFLKFAFGTVNMAIAEAMVGERVVHVIDLDGSRPAQWVAFLQTLSRAAGGPPHLKITAVNARREVLQQTAARLTEEAERLDIPFQFNQVVVPRLDALTADMVGVKTGEAVAVSAVLRLHSLLARGSPRAPVTGKRPRTRSEEDLLLRSVFLRDGARGGGSFAPSEIEAAISGRGEGAPEERLLRVLRALSPKVVAVAEVDSAHNAPALVERFVEALHYYSAVFDAAEATLPQHSAERLALEKHLLSREIYNIVACEGAERTDRHERHEFWACRLERAGFAPLPLGYPCLLNANALLRPFNCESYRVAHDKDRLRLSLCWGERPLYSVSAWQSA